MGLPILFQSAGAQPVTGVGDGDFAALLADADAVEIFRGPAAATTLPLTGSGVGREVILGTGPGILTQLEGDAAGREVIAAAGAATFTLLVGAAGGREVVSGQASALVASLAGIGAGQVTEGEPPPSEWEWELGVPFIALKPKKITGRGEGLLPRLRGKAYGRVHDDELAILVAA
jgi:hypothetical protein